jgi:hypothetical protein
VEVLRHWLLNAAGGCPRCWWANLIATATMATAFATSTAVIAACEDGRPHVDAVDGVHVPSDHGVVGGVNPCEPAKGGVPAKSVVQQPQPQPVPTTRQHAT